jgi:hypothetical protein
MQNRIADTTKGRALLSAFTDYAPDALGKEDLREHERVLSIIVRRRVVGYWHSLKRLRPALPLRLALPPCAAFRSMALLRL